MSISYRQQDKVIVIQALSQFFKKLKTVSLTSLIALILNSCSITNSVPPDATTNNRLNESSISSASQAVDERQNITSMTDTPTALGNNSEILSQGEGELFNANTALSRAINNPSNNIDIDFENSDISEFLAVILGDLLNLNYLIDPNVNGSVTIHTSLPISEEKLLPLVSEALAFNGATLVKSNGFYRVIRSIDFKAGSTAPTVGPQPGDAGFSVQVLPLEFIAATEMEKLLEPVISNNSAVNIDITRNLIIASGNPAELQAIRETIAIFDVDWLKGMSVRLFSLVNVTPEDLATELNSILNTPTSEKDNTTLGGLVRLVPLERLTSLLVVSSTATALTQVESWVKRLDQPGETAGKRLYVYPVQNAKALELADVLSRILQTGNSNDSTQGEGSVAPGLTPVEISRGNTSSIDSSSVATDDIQIIGDDIRNALIIMASPQKYAMIESAIRQLDVVPLQVLIEATILEVSLQDNLSYGVEWFFKNTIHNDEFNGFGTSDLGSSGISALAPGFSYTVLDSSDQVRVALNALAIESDINILSSPSLMVLDNQTATINVGDEIPVPTRQSISNLDPSAPTVNEISYRQTGISLTVTPRVNASGLVTMAITQEVSFALNTSTSNLDAPTIRNRQIDSVVSINSGETIMLGGLILEQDSQGQSGIPLLRKLPLFGHLFSQDTLENSRTELLVLITPRVIRDQADAKSVTDEYRSQLKLLAPDELASPLGVL